MSSGGECPKNARSLGGQSRTPCGPVRFKRAKLGPISCGSTALFSRTSNGLLRKHRIQSVSLLRRWETVSGDVWCSVGQISDGYDGRVGCTARSFDYAGAATYMPEADSSIFVPVRR